jgi:hypothetical protein
MKSHITITSATQEMCPLATLIWMFTCTYTPSFTFPDPLVNNATASGVWQNQLVEDIDDYTLYPFVLVKKVVLYVEENIHNYISYDDPDTPFTINILKNEEILDTFTISESSKKRLWLSEGMYQFCEVDLPEGYQSVFGCINHTTEDKYPLSYHKNVITFDLAIEKSGPEYCLPGDNITYYYQVTNDGPASVTPVVEDDICGTPVFTGGDTDDDGFIDSGEIWTYKCNYTVVEEPGSFIYNTVNVTDEESAGRPLDYWWLGGDRNLNDNVDNWSVEVMYPDQEDEYTLTINVIGSGSVAKDPDQPTYTYGTIVELNATADPGWIFDHWDGDLSGSKNPENINMDGDKTVIANFTEVKEEDDDKEEDDKGDDNGDDNQKIRLSLGYTWNHVPIADANGPYYGIIGELIEFDGSNSYDKDGEIIEYLWNFGDEATGSGKIVTHSYAKTGRYLVTLTVIDNYHLKSSPNNTISVIIQPNRPPSIPEISGPTPGNKGVTYSYATTSSDLDNDNLKYIFDWGDGNKDESEFITLPKGTAFSMKHSWDKAGAYTITVTVSDSQSTSSSEMTVLIEENILTDNIAIVGLGILVIIALMVALMYNKKDKKK